MQRKNRNSAALRPTRIAIAVGAAFLSSQTAWADPTANQLPTGGSVAAGAASISTNGSKMQIDQSSDRAILNWQNFSIGKDGWVNFSQPSSSSVALNRSTQPAEIFGRLSANGQVFITSQAGVYFARSAQVDVGGLLATNLSIRDQDFMAGRYVFSNEGSSGSVVNEGTIITPGGYAALAGTQVRNAGVIVAQAGTVALAAGDRVTLDMVGDGLIKVSVDAAALNALALNSGTIQADGGRVVLTARSANALLDTVVNNGGVIRARSLVERNGEIVLDGGSAGVVANNGSIDATSTTGTRGGSVQVTGQYVALTEGSSIDASGDAGGGTVTVKAVDAAFVYGTISATDTGGNGKGGSVETSGKYLEVTRAPNVGAGGTWLIDPYNIDVVEVAPPPGYSNSTGPTEFTPSGDNSQIAASLITDQLNAGANVILDTGAAGSPGTQAGDIRVLAAIDKTIANPASLTLKAFHDVQVNQPINIASAFGPTGFGTLTVEAGNDVVVSAPINLPGGGLNVRAGGFTNLSAINNGVGGDLKPGMAIFADRFDLASGTINGGQGSVGLFTRTASNSLGVESAGDTRISNADIASITTSPDSPSTNANQLLIGVGSLGAMTIGADAQVNGGSKNLIFSAGGGAGDRITIGSNGVISTGDVALDATGGAIAGTGTVGGNHVQLIASTGIGSAAVRISTAAGTLAARTGGSAFIAEADDVTLGAVTLAARTVTNGVTPGGVYDLTANGAITMQGTQSVGGRLNLIAGGSLNLAAAGGLDAQLFSNGGQTISAQSLSMTAQDGRRAVLSNAGGNQSITIGSGGMNLDVLAGAGVAQISNNAGSGTQTVETTGAIHVVGGSAAPSTNSGVFQNQTGKQTVTAGSISLQGALTGINGGAFVSNTGGGGDQEVNVAGGTISITGGAVGTANRAGIGTNGNQTINGNPDIILTGGSSGTGTGAASNSVFIAGGVGKQQIINAGTISLTAGTGGTDTSATITGSKQTITTIGDVLISGGGGGGDVNGARIGGLGGAVPGATDLKLSVGRDLKISGGSANGASVGSTVTAATPHAIDISAGRDVILEASNTAQVRIGTSFNFAPATGDIKVAAGRDIRLSGTAAQQAAIRTATNVELGAGGTISQNFNGAVLASGLKASASGDLVLTGPNAIASFDSTSTSGNVSVTNTASLDIVNVTTPGSASIVVTGNITESGSIQAGSLASSSTGSTTLAGANQIGTYTGSTTGPGSNLTLHNAGSLTIDGPVSSAGMLNLDVDGALTVSAVARDAIVTSRNGQTVTADALTLHAQNGRRAVLQNIGGNQMVDIGDGGIALNVVAGAGVAQIANNAGVGTQTVQTGGSITVVGGSAAPSANSGIFQNQTGKQTVTATNISLQGALTGNNGAALISNAGGGGDQEVNVAGGTISITGGAVGFGNRAGIVSNGNQTINGNPDIELTGGTSGGGTTVAGTSNGVFIAANGVGKTQTINATNISLTGGAGGADTFAVVTGANQQITALGDVLLAGGSGSQSAVRMGGIAGATPGPTNLVLTARDVILTGGNTAGSYATVGSAPLGASSQDNNVTVNAGRDVIVNAGIAGASIGTSLAFAAPAGGDIFIGAGRIELNGGANPAAIRTTGKVTLSTSGPDGISEGSNGFVQAGTLSTFSSNGPTNLSGPNQVGTLDAMTMGGDLTFNNTGTLNLRNVALTGNLLAPGNGSITNNGDVNVTGFVNANGALTMNVAGTLKVDADATHDAFVTSNGQTINAQSLSVSSRDGRLAILSSNAGQTIAITGGSLDVQMLGLAGAAQINSSGNQSIAVSDGDHIAVNGGGIFSGGNQTISITGTGANRIKVGETGTPRGSLILAGRNQTVTAGADVESGSITITGPAAAGTGVSGFVTVSGVGADTQTISTTGTLRVIGGTAPVQQPNINSGIFHNRQGEQTITAADITVQGGASGSNNGAFISTSGPNAAGPGGGDQVIHASSTITLRGSDSGFNNRASIFSNGNQTIDGNPDIFITAGSAGGVVGLGNTAGIGTATGRVQTIRAGTLELTSGAGGIDATAFISGGVQDIRTTGDFRITGGASGGTRGAALVGGPGGGPVLQPTILTLDVGRDLILTGGSATNDAASIGSSALGTGTPANDITITVGRDVILNSGTGAGARIGTSVLVAPTDGHISITAGRNIELNGTAQSTVIRTAGNVELHAGGTISEAANGFVVASTLDTTSGGAQNLVGPNQVSRFTAEATSGDVSLRNTASVLTLGTMDLSGSLAIDQTGALAVPGTVSALNQSIQASGGVTIGGAGSNAPAGLFAPGTISISTPQSIVLRGSDIASGGSSTVSAGGLVTLNAGDLILTGGAAQLAGTNVLGGELAVTTGHNIVLTSGTGWNANTLLYSANNITLTVGGLLTINGGHSLDNWTRVQTQRYNGVITLNFPNAGSGGVTVDGFAGKFKHGEDGFFTADKPAKLGTTLFLNYGL